MKILSLLTAASIAAGNGGNAKKQKQRVTTHNYVAAQEMAAEQLGQYPGYTLEGARELFKNSTGAYILFVDGPKGLLKIKVRNGRLIETLDGVRQGGSYKDYVARMAAASKGKGNK